MSSSAEQLPDGSKPFHQLELPRALQDLADLAGRVVLDQVIGEDEALTQVGGTERYYFDEEELPIASHAAYQLTAMHAGLGFVFSRLVLIVADARWGVSRHSPWWFAADLFVEITQLSLFQDPDPVHLHAARRIVDLQIRMLYEDQDEDRDELVLTFHAAGKLVIVPYLVNLGLDDPQDSLDRWLYRQRQREFGDPSYLADPDRQSMPSPQQAAVDALRYFDAGA